MYKNSVIATINTTMLSIMMIQTNQVNVAGITGFFQIRPVSTNYTKKNKILDINSKGEAI